MIHIGRMIDGNFGNNRYVGEGIWEKKINYGSGYRLYYVQKGKSWILLLCGGGKSTQQADIKQAKQIKKGL
jgi:putative addiction module killer protein